eukprot:1010980-Pelagomonas_calceolata.AAC.2
MSKSRGGVQGVSTTWKYSFCKPPVLISEEQQQQQQQQQQQAGSKWIGLCTQLHGLPHEAVHSRHGHQTLHDMPQTGQFNLSFLIHVNMGNSNIGGQR